MEALNLFDYRQDAVDESQLDALRLGNHLVAICENEGWTCQIMAGVELWKEVMVREKGWINPTFDPEKSPVDETNGTSVVITDRRGDFVACNALRLFVTNSFKHVMSTGELFYGPKTRFLRPVPLILPEGHADLRGQIGYSGGTLVSPAYRGKRIGLLITRLVRVIAERLYLADHHAGHVIQTRPISPSPPYPYHFSRCAPCMPYLHLPERHKEAPVFLVDISRTAFLSQLRRDIGKFVREGNQTLDDIALVVP